MEGAGDVELHRARARVVARELDGRVDHLERAAQNDLSRRVVVRDRQTEAARELRDRVRVAAQHRDHAARLGRCGILHRGGALVDEEECVVERQRAGRMQGRVLAERVPGRGDLLASLV